MARLWQLNASSDNLAAFHGRIARPPLGTITPDMDVFLAIDVPRGISVRARQVARRATV